MRYLTLLPALALAAPAAAQDAAPGFALTYVCAGRAVLQAAYLNPSGSPGLAVVAYAGRLVPMRAGPAASGVRYVALDGSGLVWHTKGAEGFLARDDGIQETLLDGCRSAEG